MTFSNARFSPAQAASRPAAAMLSLAFVAAFWLPTISTPAHAAPAAEAAVHEAPQSEAAFGNRIVIAAPVAPALM
ncbi:MULTISPECIES: hypothetical protein [Novosphingobium]|uniref:Uncharacterized protein n=1 Tax=Novosphingobium pentaromativorans TaxID=205844 RepID=A0A2W5NKU7_9SPHN|nr:MULTISPECIES: hypothetical protein [Novosphingobium]PZQ52889.1 MAG: hypothetical protein DI555_19465 [Novosphingobium pentaromativorans]GFE73101.1 hypothetical protein NTCA1_07500 [Novosphingobium sp. TCA1]